MTVRSGDPTTRFCGLFGPAVLDYEDDVGTIGPYDRTIRLVPERRFEMDKTEQKQWDLATSMVRWAGNNLGWTVSINSSLDPNHGYGVGGGPVQEKVIPNFRNLPGPFVVHQVACYVDDIHNANREMSGGWVREDGALVLDSPDIIESRSQAIALGRKRGEDAIYCLHTGETITL